jgi:hypothetical protein
MGILCKITLYFSLVLLAAGCEGQLTDYVDGAKRETPVSTPTIRVNTASPMFFKVTPGKLNSVLVGGSGGAMNGTVTPNNRVLSLGSDMAIAITVNRSRSSPQ